MDRGVWQATVHSITESRTWLKQLQFSSVQSLSRILLFATPWIAARQASVSITSSQSSLKLTSIELVMPSSHLILCCPLLLPSSIFPNIRVFSNKSPLCIRWPNYWSCSFNISPSNEHPGLISFRMDWLDLLAVQRTRLWNEAGQRLIEFCQENALVIANTLFQQHKRRLYTWTSPDGQH